MICTRALKSETRVFVKLITFVPPKSYDMSNLSIMCVNQLTEKQQKIRDEKAKEMAKVRITLKFKYRCIASLNDLKVE